MHVGVVDHIYQIQPRYGERAGWRGTAEPVSRDKILRRYYVRGQGDINFPCSADHGQDGQPYPVDLYSFALCVTIHLHLTPNSINTYQFLWTSCNIQVWHTEIVTMNLI